MSYQDGLGAINLDMPARVPRTEYSVDFHWKLVSRVTGKNVDENSAESERSAAAHAFRRAWDYSMIWRTIFSGPELGKYRTDMGHAIYVQGGGDYRQKKEDLFADPEQALRLDPLSDFPQPDVASIIARINSDYEKAKNEFPYAVATTGVYITCISGLIEIFGWDMLLTACGTDPERFGALTNRYGQWMMRYYEALARSDAPVIMVHDDMVWTQGAFIHPDWYRKFVFPNYKRYFAPLIEAGKRVLFTSDGGYTQFIDDLAQTGIHGFCMEPMTDMALIAERYGKTHAIIGNADTRVLLYGNKESIRAEVARCMNIGKSCPGFIMAVGNHIPPNTPVENALIYNEAYEQMAKR